MSKSPDEPERALSAEPCQHSCKFGAVHRDENDRLTFDCEKCGQRDVTNYYFRSSTSPDKAASAETQGPPVTPQRLRQMAYIERFSDRPDPEMADELSGLADYLEKAQPAPAFCQCGHTKESHEGHTFVPGERIPDHCACCTSCRHYEPAPAETPRPAEGEPLRSDGFCREHNIYHRDSCLIDHVDRLTLTETRLRISLDQLESAYKLASEERDRLTAENARLVKDKERLDWLDTQIKCNGEWEAVSFWPNYQFSCANPGAKNAHMNVREAIDAARKEPG